MSKSTIISLFLIVIIVVVAAELLVNDYTSYPEVQKKITGGMQNGDIKTSILGQENEIEEKTRLIDFSADGLAPKATVDLAQKATPGATASGTGTVTSMMDGQPAISFSLISQVGLNNVVLQRIPFNGIIGETVDMRDFKSVPIIQQNLLQNNRDKIAEFYEIHAGSLLLANEVYLLIKEKASQSIEATINQTNEYGTGSFYANYVKRGESAFLVVKVRESVYAFVYKKELHSFIKSLIILL